MTTILTDTIFVPPTIPAGAVRVTQVSQMYTIVPNTFQHDMLHLIGEQQTNFTKSYTFTNITTNANLAITIDVPSYIKSSVSTITIKPKQQIVINVELDRQASTDRFVATKQSTVNDAAMWVVTPVNFSGPVYIPVPQSTNTTASVTSTNMSNQPLPPAPVAKIIFDPPNLIPAIHPLPPRVM